MEQEIYFKYYSIEARRDQLYHREQFSEGDYHLWHWVNALFSLLYNGFDSTEVRVTAYNGGLFSPDRTEIINRCSLNDLAFRDVLFELSTTVIGKGRSAARDRVSYRELGVEQLGAVYEGLLEYEPKIATEEMIVVKVKKDFQVMPVSRAKKVPDGAERIPSGKFYLSLWGGRRKGTGSYYTPEPITRFLVEQALEPLTESVVENGDHEGILKLKVVDPAMGSGAFLVAATNFLAQAYMDARVNAGLMEHEEADEYELARCRRIVTEHCIYGVDLNPMAVELAKVSLWLTTMADERPLTFLDHHLRCGNSLIGAPLRDKSGNFTVEKISQIPNEALKETGREKEAKERAKQALDRNKDALKGQLALFSANMEVFDEVLGEYEEHRRIMEESDETEPIYQAIERIKLKESLLRDDTEDENSPFCRLKRVCDLWCSVWFWPQDTELLRPDSYTYWELVSYTLDGRVSDPRMLSEGKMKRYLSVSEEIAKRMCFFHWELEFPEIYRRENPGFDTVLGNPPWDIIKPNSQEFFSNCDPEFRSYTKRLAKQRMQSLCEENSDISEQWQLYVRDFEQQSHYFRKSEDFPHLGKGDINSFKLFMERDYSSIRNGGKLSLVVPSGIYTDKGCQPLRELFLENANIDFLYCFENRKRLFPIHRSFKFVLFSLAKGEHTNSFLCAFMLHDIDLLPGLKHGALTMSVENIRRFSPDSLSVMELKSQRDIDIVRKYTVAGLCLGRN